MESNDSPEIPDRGETSDIPRLPSGVIAEMKLPDTVNANMMFTFFVPPKKLQELQTLRPFTFKTAKQKLSVQLQTPVTVETDGADGRPTPGHCTDSYLLSMRVKT